MNIDDVHKVSFDAIRQYRGKFFSSKHIMVDTETIEGKAYTIQFYYGEGEAELFYVTEDTILDVFLDYLEEHFESGMVVWFFYMQFDLPIIFAKHREYFCFDSHKIEIGHFDFDFVTAKSWFADCRWYTQKFFIRDAFQFIFRGLAKACADLGIKNGKLPAPHYLGTRAPSKSEKEYFEQYAKQDVYALYDLVYWILNLHSRYGVGLSVSLADLCGKIFRKKYFHSSDIIRVPDSEIIEAALKSYHGGKTECYIDTPVYIRDVYEYDISSAYPWAMVTMPNFFDYEVIHRSNIMLKEVKEDGLYNISGDINCQYRPVYNHDFVFSNYIHKTWVTGYELQGMIERKEFDGIIHEVFFIESNREAHNPIIDYVKDFFELKSTARQQKNITEALWAKLALNSLYGKFIARVEYEDEMQEDLFTYWKAGVLFNPLMATCITGKLRGLIHKIEHVLNVYHTSTDSFITKSSDGENLFRGIGGLGALRQEHRGDCLIIRRKLYLIFEEGKIVKQALHGFQGTAQMLETLWKHRMKNYQIKRMIRMKEARISKDPEMIAFTFRTQKRSMNIDWSKYREI